MSKKILLVDDDPNILQGYSRQFRKQFQIETASGGKEGLETTVKSGPFAVIISDMQMPEMNGIQFLNSVCKIAPDSVRIMLTGNADQKTAMDAVNDGQIFRFLTKPCSPEAFCKSIESGLEQYRLVTAERELLSKTLCGSVGVLTDVLSLVNPTAFGQSASVRRITRQICQITEVENSWEIEVAAMLSQVGCVTIPEKTLAKLSSGVTLSAEEHLAYQNHPKVGAELIAKIPRLKEVADIIASQHKHFDGSGMPSDGREGEQIPLGARVLKLVIDVVQLTSSGKQTEDIWTIISDRKGWYDLFLVDAIVEVLNIRYIVKSVNVEDLEDGMVLDEHVKTEMGDLLLTSDHEVTASLRERLSAFVISGWGVREPIRVRCPIHRYQTTNQTTTLEQQDAPRLKGIEI